MAGDALQRVLSALEAHGKRWRHQSGGYRAQCPAHDDEHPSLSVTNGDGTVALKCHGGAACSAESIVGALGLRMSDLWDSDHSRESAPSRERDWILDDYHDERGAVLYQKVRMPGKKILFRHPGATPGSWEWGAGKNTQRVLFRLPGVLAAVREGRTVYVAEGEPDCKRLISLGYAATCNDNGASTSGHAAKWRPQYTETLVGARVVVIADNDEPGFAHARYIARELTGKAASVTLVRGAVNTLGADFSDHHEAGFAIDAMIPVLDADKPPVKPDKPPVEEVQAPLKAPAKDVKKGSEPSAPAVRKLKPTKASEIVMRRVRWLWNLRIVLGGLTLLAGREGIGKSCVAVDLCTQVTRGTLPGEMYGTPRNVIYVNSEDARDYTIVPRLAAARADLGRVIFLDAVTGDGEYESNIVLPLDTDALAEAVTRHDAALVILDAATSVIDSRLDGDKDRQMRQGLEAIARKVGERTGCAVLGIVHFSKRDSADTGKLITGSIAWSQVARSTLAVAQDTDTGQLVLTASKANLAPGNTPSLAARIVSVDVSTPEGPTSVGRVEWLGESDRDARDLLDPEAMAGRAERDEAREWLRAYLRAGWKRSADAKRDALKAGIAERTLQRARADIRVKIRSEGFPPASWWALSAADDHREATGGHVALARTCSVDINGSIDSDLRKQGGTNVARTVARTVNGHERAVSCEDGDRSAHAAAASSVPPFVPVEDDHGTEGGPGIYASCASYAREHARASQPPGGDQPGAPATDGHAAPSQVALDASGDRWVHAYLTTKPQALGHLAADLDASLGSVRSALERLAAIGHAQRHQDASGHELWSLRGVGYVEPDAEERL